MYDLLYPSVFPPTEKVAETFNKAQVSVDVRNESQVRVICEQCSLVRFDLVVLLVLGQEC